MTLTPGWYHSHTPEPDTVYDRSRLRRFRLEDAMSGRVYEWAWVGPQGVSGGAQQRPRLLVHALDGQGPVDPLDDEEAETAETIRLWLEAEQEEP